MQETGVQAKAVPEQLELKSEAASLEKPELKSEPEISAGAKTPKRPKKTRWNKYATRLIQMEMLRQDITFKVLARRLKELDTDEEHTEGSLVTRVGRGTFTFAFVLQVLRALKVDSLDLKQLPMKSKGKT